MSILELSPSCLALTLILSACGDDQTADGGETAGATTNASAGTEDSSGEGTETDTGGSTDPSGACDPLAQDCPEGEKCLPWASSGGTWDALECVPILGDQVPGEPCTSNGPVEATDDCDGSGMCFGYDEMLMGGTCYGICGPGHVCPEGQGCLVANDGALNLCLDLCRPQFPEDCSPGTVCAWTMDMFACTPGVPTLDPDAICEPGEVCAPGQGCVAAGELEGCGGASCCTDLCDTGEPDPCVAPLTCQPWFEMGQALEGLETMGSCRLP